MRVESNVTGTNVDTDAIVASLNKLLRGELSAVDTYNQALEKLRGSALIPDLTECRRSHEERVMLLKQQVTRFGGTPSDGAGPWGSFARLVEGGAKMFGEKAALAALEEGEDHGLKLYRNELDKLDVVSRDVVERSLLPEQERTHQVMSAIKHTIH
jgi:uncharacterized protein (TIGR02284 family)